MPPNQRSTRLGSILSVRDLSLAELSSARLDGEIYALGDSWCPIDEIDGPVNRARTVSLLVPVPAVAERASAAWIFGLTPEPACHELRVDSRARKHVAPSVRLRVREVRDPFADTDNLDGIPVTTPLRTAADLALCRSHHASGPAERALVELLASLLQYSGCRDTRQAVRLCAPEHSAAWQRAVARFDAVQELWDNATLDLAGRDSSRR